MKFEPDQNDVSMFDRKGMVDWIIVYIYCYFDISSVWILFIIFERFVSCWSKLFSTKNNKMKQLRASMSTKNLADWKHCSNDFHRVKSVRFKFISALLSENFNTKLSSSIKILTKKQAQSNSTKTSSAQVRRKGIFLMSHFLGSVSYKITLKKS